MVEGRSAIDASLITGESMPVDVSVDDTVTGATVNTSGLRPPLATLTVNSPFGYRTNPLTGAAAELHTGVDFAGSCGTAVFAAGAGMVTEAGWSQYGGGNRIVVDHGGGIKTTYNYLNSIAVSVGQRSVQVRRSLTSEQRGIPPAATCILKSWKIAKSLIPRRSSDRLRNTEGWWALVPPPAGGSSAHLSPAH